MSTFEWIQFNGNGARISKEVQGYKCRTILELVELCNNINSIELKAYNIAIQNWKNTPQGKKVATMHKLKNSIMKQLPVQIYLG